MLLEISGEVTPKGTKRQSQSKKQHPNVEVTGNGSKAQCCIFFMQQYCIGTWNVRSMNQREIGNGETGDGKSEHQHFSNQ